ncbi:Uncharacterised protein [uncultured archaeon]|nr:Uncharacterised protein [uncultured archaeon]
MSERCIVSVQVSSSITFEGAASEAKARFLEKLKAKLGSDFRVDEKSFLISSGVKV